MTLQQNQVWQQGDEYLRIVRVERTAVEYKTTKGLNSRAGSHRHASKKEFCRMLKGATLLTTAAAGMGLEPPPAAAAETGDA